MCLKIIQLFFFPSFALSGTYSLEGDGGDSRGKKDYFKIKIKKQTFVYINRLRLLGLWLMDMVLHLSFRNVPKSSGRTLNSVR